MFCLCVGFVLGSALLISVQRAAIQHTNPNPSQLLLPSDFCFASFSGDDGDPASVTESVASPAEEALEFSQSKLAPFGNVHRYVEKLQDVIALLAYEDPEKSPMFHSCFNSFSHRPEHANHPSHTPMERLLQQVTVVSQYLTEKNGKDAFPLFSLKDSLKG
ncbi:hypothetical protein Bca4012_020178 [Brassica carinata]|uniref:CRA domain-containing protein n=1 Tax=Brassica carinata TaxID=52824 RepID=A0A8X7WJC5_BRACI|nr:hypothetical protein Bca52824_001410 [Brassica carinata]